METVEAAAECATDDGGGQVTNTVRGATEGSAGEIRGATKVEIGSVGKSLVVLQVNCRSICNKVLEFWNLIETYNPDVIGTESWLHEEVNNAEVFRDNYITCRRYRSSRGSGVFICIKNHVSCKELWLDEDFEILAVEINNRNHKYTWDTVGLYTAPNDDMRVLQRLIARTLCARNPEKCSIIAGDLMPRVDWNGNAEGNNPTQALVNTLVCQVVYSPTRGDAILDVYLVRP